MRRLTTAQLLKACLLLAMMFSWAAFQPMQLLDADEQPASAFSFSSVRPDVVPGTLQARTGGAGPQVRFTWMSRVHWFIEAGDRRVLIEGWVTRNPTLATTLFVGGPKGGLASTTAPQKPDVAAVERVLEAIGGKVDFILSGHSHWDHTQDVATWAKLTGAQIIGSKTTCFQAFAQGITTSKCTTVDGGEVIPLGTGIKLRVVRWNHGGTNTTNPYGHPPVELNTIPKLDPVTGGLRLGVAEDFPNGGGGRAYLFTVDNPGGSALTWFYANSSGTDTWEEPVIVDGKNFGAPKSNLIAAMAAAGLKSVDVLLGGASKNVAEALVPLLKPKAYHPQPGGWSDTPFFPGMQSPFQNKELEAYLAKEGVELLVPKQFMESWKLDAQGVTRVSNQDVQKKLGFAQK